MNSRSGSPQRVDLDGLTMTTEMHPDDFGPLDGKLLNDGTTRRVYKIADGLVLKVPLYDGITFDNQQEVELWLKVEEEDKPWFARPFIWADDFSWSVMEFAHNVGSLDPQSYKDVYSVMKKYNVSDLHSHNMGFRITEELAHPVCIDYACIYS